MTGRLSPTRFVGDDAPWLPDLRLDDCVPTAFVAFSVKGKLSEFYKALKADAEACRLLTAASPLSVVSGFDDDRDEPRVLKDFMGGIMVSFSGLASARRKTLPGGPLYACVLGGCKNNFLAAALARKALLYTLGCEAAYVSPVAANEVVKSKHGSVHTAKMFAALTLRELAGFTQRRCVEAFACDGSLPYDSQLSSINAAV